MRLDEWNERYRSREEIDLTPARLLVDTAGDLTPGRALDLACGAGRNALWLRAQGWDVVAIDGAEEAIRIVREHDAAHRRARARPGERCRRCRSRTTSFDLVVILYFLHRPLFAEAQTRGPSRVESSSRPFAPEESIRGSASRSRSCARSSRVGVCCTRADGDTRGA